jgi:hypothetical protein
MEQARKFFAAVLDLNYAKRSHRKTYLKILLIVDPEKNNIVFKDRIMEFFATSGFQIIAQLHKE